MKRLDLGLPGIDEDFINVVFRTYWEANHHDEPAQYFSIREAFQTFRELTGLSRDRIAAYLGITTGYLGQIEAGKKLVPPGNYAALRELAKSYSLRNLTRFFDDLEYKAKNSQGATTSRKMKHGDKGAMPNWRDVMGE